MRRSHDEDCPLTGEDQHHLWMLYRMVPSPRRFEYERPEWAFSQGFAKNFDVHGTIIARDNM